MCLFAPTSSQKKHMWINPIQPPQPLSPSGWRTSRCSDTSTPISLTSGLSHRWWNLHFFLSWCMSDTCVCYNLLPGLKSIIFFRIQVRGATGAFGKRIELFSRFKAKCFFPKPKVNLKFSGMAPSIPPWTSAEEEKWKPFLDDGFNCQHCQHWVMGQLLSTLQRYHLYSWLVLVQKLQSNN